MATERSDCVLCLRFPSPQFMTQKIAAKIALTRFFRSTGKRLRPLSIVKEKDVEKTQPTKFSAVESTIASNRIYHHLRYPSRRLLLDSK